MSLCLGEYRIALDCVDSSANVNFVSHAHSDHISGLRKNKSMIGSEITRELIVARKNTEIEMVAAPDKCSLLNAGHMLGSKQLYIESEEHGCSIIYSGDYQIQESCAAERIETRKADILIMDSTYPYAKIVFEDRREVMDAIQAYTKAKLEKGIVVFNAYSMGKAQELIKVLNEVGISPVVDSKISRINKVYQKHGVHLDYASEDDPVRLSEETRSNFVSILSTSKLRESCVEISATHRKRIFTAVATGFAKMMKFDTDVQFALSDHADFMQALEYIERCDPSLIYTVGSGAGMFTKNLANFGYQSEPLEKTGEIGKVMLNKV